MRSALTDQQIIEGIRNKDSFVLNQVYALFRPKVINFVLYNEGTEYDAEDVLQESIVIIYKEVIKDGFVLRKSFDSYFGAIFKNTWKCIAKLKNRISLRPGFSEEMRDIEPDFYQDFKRDLYKRIITETLTKMGGNCQLVLEMFYYDKLPMQEIADNLGYKSAQMAKNKRFRCLAILKKMIKTHYLYSNLN